jgi:hypothetical protein
MRGEPCYLTAAAGRFMWTARLPLSMLLIIGLLSYLEAVCKIHQEPPSSFHLRLS